jgi:hypothetical protein
MSGTYVLHMPRQVGSRWVSDDPGLVLFAFCCLGCGVRVQVLGQKKTREYRQLGWRLLGRPGTKPPANYFRYHNVPQFEVTLSGLLGVAVTRVEGEGLLAAVAPDSELPVPVWGDADWVLSEWPGACLHLCHSC